MHSLNKLCITEIYLAYVANSTLTFAPWNVAVRVLDIFACSIAPRAGVGRRRDDRIAAEIDDVLDESVGIGRVIGEPRDIVKAMIMRRVITPLLTRYSRRSVIYAAYIVFTGLGT